MDRRGYIKSTIKKTYEKDQEVHLDLPFMYADFRITQFQ